MCVIVFIFSVLYARFTKPREQEYKPIVQEEYIRKGLEKSLPVRHHGLIPENEQAIKVGMEIVHSYHTI